VTVVTEFRLPSEVREITNIAPRLIGYQRGDVYEWVEDPKGWPRRAAGAEVAP
jgi:hypothetical protein